MFKKTSPFFQRETNSLNYKAKRPFEILSIATMLVKGKAVRRLSYFVILGEKAEAMVQVLKITNPSRL